MSIRGWFLGLIYPVPQKDEDLLMHKKEFIEEYISLHQFFADCKMFFTPQKLWNDAHHQKKVNDQEQRARLLAHKAWQNFIKKDKEMKLFNILRRKQTPVVSDVKRAKEDFERQIRIIRVQDKHIGESLYDFVQQQVIEYHKPQKGCDVLAKKEAFFDCYTFQEHYQSSEAVLPENLKKEQKSSAYQKIWSKKWHDYDQRARLVAHKKWREMMSNSR